MKRRIAKNSITALLLSAAIFCGFLSSSTTVRIFLVGDSTMADKPLVDNPERGWGQVFPGFFDRHVIIENRAVNGRSTKSFINQGRWQIVLDELRPDDYVFIQFGHNDEKKDDTSRYAAPETDYKNNLIKFVHETRAKGAFPVLLTPVSRRKFDERGKAVETHQEYSEVVRRVAKEEKVPLIDLDAKSVAMLDILGPEKSKSVFLWIPAGKYKALPAGKKDSTHFTFDGAEKIAGLVVNGIIELHLPIESRLMPANHAPDVGKGKVVLLDYFFNNERKAGPDNRPMRFHYVWEDTANSGFSELGKTIMELGADVDTLEVGPTAQNLSHASIYMIVDPDTPLESADPHYIDSSAREAIVKWVSAGGILLLFGNDKGNAEFEHLNMLAEHFGIHFNEDSRNKVQGNDFEMGAFANLPSHPMFRGVNKIYLKEISTLKLSGSAEPILTDKGDVIIGYSKFGNGSVLAVGDPWFYNEYYDNKKLPEAFENYKAAENLFRWLLQDAKTVKQ
jgi:lysophospholipase L1-like esterase